jgi:predicted  nucleic acid-binding Zn-ribbon protein
MSFSCMECGHQFKTVKSAERAAFGDRGCPKCGGSDIDLSETKSKGRESWRTSSVASTSGSADTCST